MKSFRLPTLSALAFFAATQVWGQVTLNFDDLTLANYAPIPQTYGDRLDPRILIDYRTFVQNTGATAEAHLEFWNNDYGDLQEVAYASRNGNVAEITFTADVGYAVNLISFDMAGYPHQDRQNTIMRILDASNNIVFDFATNGPVPIEGSVNAPQHSTFTPNITVDGTLKLQWGNDWDIGIDNIRFQAVAIPEYPTLVLLGTGLAGLVLQRRLRKRS